MNQPVKKYAAAILPLLVLLLLFVPNTSHAACIGLGGINLADCVTGVFRIVAFFLNFIGGVLFSLAGFLVNIMLNLNLEVLDAGKNPLVHVGWQLVRDIANLGFVLVIIVIAFATILRFEQYGVTKLLPKLIAAAIIVNFSFAIAAAFINFTHVLTDFFADRALGEGRDLSTAISNAFGPQRFFIESDPLPPNPEEDVGGLTEFGTAVLTSITGLVFTVIFTFIAAFVLLAFAFMLLMRYLYLTFLVILAPLIWLFWVIPDLKGQFNKWWNKFLQWTFFAPAMMFFIYLALVSTRQLGDIRQEFAGGNFFSSSLASTMIHGAQIVVLSGILIGGLIIAQKMGIIGAAGAMGMATKAGKAGRTWAGRQAVKAGSLPARTKWGRDLTEGIQKAGGNLAKTGTTMGRFGKFVTAPIRGVGKGLGQAGAGLSTAGIVQGENLVKQAEERQKSLSDKQLALRVGTMGKDERTSALIRLAKNKKLHMVPDMAHHISNPDTKAVFESYGKGEEYSDVEKTFGANTAMLTAKTDDERNKAAEEFYSGLSKQDLNKIQYNDIYAKTSKFGLSDPDHKLLQNAITRGITITNPGDVRKILANVKSENIVNASDSINKVAMDVYQASATRAGDPDLAKKIEDNRVNTLFKRGAGELFEFEPPTSTPPPAP
jgi:hypothetical protein